VIGTLKHLLETGDKAQTIEGIFSGTLSYIFNTFGDGRPFSEIVAGAKAEVGEGGGIRVGWGGVGWGGVGWGGVGWGGVGWQVG
jgi:hypothetical protein